MKFTAIVLSVLSTLTVADQSRTSVATLHRYRPNSSLRRDIADPHRKGVVDQTTDVLKLTASYQTKGAVMKFISSLLVASFFITSAFAAPTRLEIIKIGHPTLRQIARELTMAEIQSPEIQKLIDDMVYTMKVSNGVGLAAPQVDVPLRLFVMGVGRQVPLTVVINPKIVYQESYGQKNSVEGCLSIPGRSVRVKRFKRILMSYLNRKGEYVSEEVKDFKAIISQHEGDHLDGVLITDLVEQMNESFDMSQYANAHLM